MKNKRLAFAFIFTSLAFLSVCNNNIPSPATLTKIQVTSDVADLPAGFSTQLTAVAYYSNGQTENISYAGTWNSLTPQHTTVDKG